MGDGIYTALTGAIAQQHSLDIVANNVANVNTVGYRGDRSVFAEVLKNAGKGGSATSGSNPKPDRFVNVDAVMRDTTDGTHRQTGNRLDFALHGDGFFVVRTGDGDRLTRAGSFMTRADGTLTAPDGSAVLGDDGNPIKLPSQTANIQVNQAGVLSADGTPFNKFLLGRVADARNLQKAGNNYVSAPSDGKLVKATTAEVSQGFVEVSNVNPVAGLNELISINRSFDALQKAIDTFKQIDDRCVRDVGSRT